MAEKFFSINDAANKLENVIVLVNGEPHYDSGFSAEGDKSIHNDYFIFINLRTHVPEYIKYTDDSVSFANFELGCFGDQDYFTYLCRLPHRANNVGLSRVNTDTRLTSSQFVSNNMYNCITGKHPTFEEVKNKIFDVRVGSSLPFHRHAWMTRTEQYCASIKFVSSTIGTFSSSGKVNINVYSPTKMLEKILKKIGVQHDNT